MVRWHGRGRRNVQLHRRCHRLQCTGQPGAPRWCAAALLASRLLRRHSRLGTAGRAAHACSPTRRRRLLRTRLRPSGKVCMLSGHCTAGCTVPIRGEDGAIVARRPLDQCTHNGTEGGLPVPPPATVNGSRCKSDADCAVSDGWCELGTSVTRVRSLCAACAAPIGSGSSYFYPPPHSRRERPLTCALGAHSFTQSSLPATVKTGLHMCGRPG